MWNDIVRYWKIVNSFTGRGYLLEIGDDLTGNVMKDDKSEYAFDGLSDLKKWLLQQIEDYSKELQAK